MKRTIPQVIFRTLLASVAMIAATCTVLFASDLFSGTIVPETYPGGVPEAPAELRAMSVRTRGNADFPSEPGLSVKAQKAELEEIAAFANTYGYNALFFEAVPAGDALYRSALLPSSASWTGKQGAFVYFDPLKYLTNITKVNGIRVYAVINPFALDQKGLADTSPAVKNPAWVQDGYLNPAQTEVQKLAGKVTAELTENYDIAGVVLSGVDSAAYGSVENYAACVAKLAAHAHDSLRDKSVQRLGMVVSGEGGKTQDLYSAPLKNGDLDFLVPLMDGVSSNRIPETLSSWKAVCDSVSTEKRAAAFYPLHSAGDSSAFSHAIDNSLYFERQAGCKGTVISNYSALHTEARTAAYTLAAAFAQTAPTAMPDLTYSREFAVTRPTETLTVASDWSTYFVTGTSDPEKPVLLNGQEISRISKNGLWGVQVNVRYGTNTYTFSQNGVSKTVSIVRNQPSSVTQISNIVKSSVYPSASEAVLDGEKLKLSCNAPAGGTVSATVGGLTAELTPIAQVQQGVAVTYQATLDLSEKATPGQVKNLGPVTYRLNYAGMNSTQESGGEVFAAGRGAVPTVKMKTFVVPVNANPKDDGQYAAILKKDCVDAITKNDGSGYYQLSSGGYVLKSAVEIPEGTPELQNTVSAIALQRTPKGEKIIVSGSVRPAFTGAATNGAVTVTLYNTAGFDRMNPEKLRSRLCSSIAGVSNPDGSVTLTFMLQEGVKLLGWDIQFEDNNAIIYLKEAPILHTDTAAPLSDVSVVLDPGHGGDDPGAIGIPGALGPAEKTLNLANAYALQSRLQALGATVHIVQEDETMTLNDRMELAQKYDADLFISSHHNSLGLTADANTAAGIEVYYYTEQSEPFARQIGQNLTEDTGRKLRFVQQSWYRVTMMTACPAVLVESGYVSNAAEYEKLATDYAMFQYGNAVADAVLQFFGA